MVLFHDLLGFFFSDYLYLVSFATAQRKFVSQDFIFYRITKRSVEYDRDFLS